MAPPKSNSPGAGGAASPDASTSLPAKSCRNCAHAREHKIRFADLPDFEKAVRVCAAGSAAWTSVVTQEGFFTNGPRWKERASQCDLYRRKLGAG